MWIESVMPGLLILAALLVLLASTARYDEPTQVYVVPARSRVSGCLLLGMFFLGMLVTLMVLNSASWRSP